MRAEMWGERAGEQVARRGFDLIDIAQAVARAWMRTCHPAGDRLP